MAQESMFQWRCQPEAEALIQGVLDPAVQANSDIADLQNSLLEHTSSRLFDWLDHVVVGDSEEIESKLNSSGFVSDGVTPASRIFHHPGAQLPRVIVQDHAPSICGVAVTVESIADFLMVRGRTGWIEGSLLSGYRRCLFSTDNEVSFWLVERRGTMAMEPTYFPPEYVENFLSAVEKWETRPRNQFDEEEAMDHTLQIAEELIQSIGRNLAACIVLQVERKYWQARNLAGQLQKNRQDKLGMGWANHDHHTFRSSRKTFHQLVRLFEMLGFHCRERFYAGAEAGWGAQVMENSEAGLVLFLDVDLDPREVEVDFSHHPLPDLPELGTIGLWCELHGNSILQAGMHHLEAQFLFDELKDDLQKVGIGMMQPFSNFPYLKQAFTQGELWSVDSRRVELLLQKNKITVEQSKKFLEHGAVGSHMENLQRREGYKGFNQKNVSVIIRETDPRHLRP